MLAAMGGCKIFKAKRNGFQPFTTPSSKMIKMINSRRFKRSGGS